MANLPAHGRPGATFARMGGVVPILLIGIGLLVIAVGANGIRSNDLVVEQMPYILTGGVVGMAFVVFGSAYLVVQNARLAQAALEDKLTQLIDAIAAGGGGGSGPTTAGAPADLAGLVVAGTASYHAPGCRLVDGREEVRYLTPTEAAEQDLKACRVCQPESARGTDVITR